MSKGLQFGTAGIRLKMGEGDGFLNLGTVRKISNGLSLFCNSRVKDKVPLICISYDSRNNSREFAECAACAFAANGIKVQTTKTLMPTPYLSFSVRHCKADFGVMITASHNPKEYNGYKVYGADGCQLTDESSAQLSEFINGTDYKSNTDAVNPNADNFDRFVSSGMIAEISCKRIYLDAVEESIFRVMSGKENSGDFKDKNAVMADSAKGLQITYTPLNGAGHALVPEILGAMGAEVYEVFEQSAPDGDFATCPNPNPEQTDAFKLALEYAAKNNSDLILATDPDADRIGIMIKHGHRFVKLSGNEVGVLLADYILKNQSFGKIPVVMRTVVTTPLLDKIADKYGAGVCKVLTGFKYIGEQISLLENNNTHEYAFGFEESCGYLKGMHARDKDAVEAAALIALMAAEYKKQGKNLADALEDLYKEHGYYRHKTLSFGFEGGADKAVMAALRKEGQGVLSEFQNKHNYDIKDYLIPQNNLPSADMLEFLSDSGWRIIIRPSGTEPLIKVYIAAVGKKEQAKKILKSIEDMCGKILDKK